MKHITILQKNEKRRKLLRRGKDLLGTFLSDIVLALLSYVAENERNNIRKRQAEGIMAAMERGVIFGRPERPLPQNFEQVYLKWKNKQISTSEAAAMLEFPRSTFYNKVKKYEKSILYK